MVEVIFPDKSPSAIMFVKILSVRVLTSINQMTVEEEEI